MTPVFAGRAPSALADQATPYRPAAMGLPLPDAPFRLPPVPRDADLLSKGEPQAKVSNHLACLRWCGFVATRREHRTVHYRLADEHAAACRRVD